MRVTYGYDVPEAASKDAFISYANEAMEGFSQASEPGAFLVDTLPWLKYVPDWFPGAQFKRLAKEMSAARERLYQFPYFHVKNEMVCGFGINIWASI